MVIHSETGNNTNMISASVIGVPFHGGQPKEGVDLGPSVLREAGVVDVVKNLGWEVVYDADVPIPPRTETQVNKLKDPLWVGGVCKDVYNSVHARAKNGDLCLVLGGDHSIAIGSIGAMLTAHPDLCVIWVDAHADINTPDTTDSGNLHGMPVAFLAKLTGEVPGFEWLHDIRPLPLDRLVYIGLRDVDEGEKVLLKKYNIKHYTSDDVARVGIAAVMEEVVAYVKDSSIHISFDIDALDPNFAPATGTPVPDGMTLQDGKYICEKLAATGKVVSMDVVEVNPKLSDSTGAGITHDSAVQLVKTALGRRRN